MNPDDIISAALLGRQVQGEGLYIVEGNPRRNLLRIIPADKAFKDHLDCFAWNINTGFQFLGIFTDESLAQNYIEQINERINHEGNDHLVYHHPEDILMHALSDRQIQGMDTFIVEGNPQDNELRIVPADEAYKDNLSCFVRHINSGFQYMGIFTEEKLAQTYIAQIRQVIRNERGQRLF